MSDRALAVGVEVGNSAVVNAMRMVARQIIVQRQGFRRGPLVRQLKSWVRAALDDHPGAAVVTLRIVLAAEMRQLNRQYRGKDYATNVLAFPLSRTSVARRQATDTTLHGDVVICAPVVAAEAAAQGKDCAAHWAHLTVHGVLHLRGFDHETAADAARMEAREISLLARLGVADPYVLADENVVAGGASAGKR